jgi:glutaminyl-peptide cyclotransferase
MVHARRLGRPWYPVPRQAPDLSYRRPLDRVVSFREMIFHLIRRNALGTVFRAAFFLFAISSLPAIAQSSARAPEPRTRKIPGAPLYTFKVIHTFPHDQNAFTQGLVFHDGFLYEGTGLNGRSSLRKVRLETGEVLQKSDLPREYFGEGIAIVKNEIFQLTWQSKIGFVFDRNDFHFIRQFSYKGEGWGLAANAGELFMSDGTSEIRVMDPATFTEKRRFTVRDGNKSIDQLNELEFVEGQLFANIWNSDRIALISPQTGKVLGWIDLAGILSPIYRREAGAVLNGIAYDSAHKRLFVTGKLWPSIFEIRLAPKRSS